VAIDRNRSTAGRREQRSSARLKPSNVAALLLPQLYCFCLPTFYRISFKHRLLSIMSSDSVPNLRSTSTLSDNTVVAGDPEGLETLGDFLIKAGFSPPPKNAKAAAKAGEEYMHTIMAQVNDLLAPINKGWQDLEYPHGKAKMSFLVSRGQQNLLREKKYKGQPASHHIAQDLWSAVVIEECFAYKRVDSLLKKGGDERISLAEGHEREEGEDYFASFLANHGADWSDSEKSPTLFNHADAFFCMKPLLRTQEDSSTVCAWIAVANAIFYNMCLQTGTIHEEAVEIYALNLNRTMRNYCSNEELFEIIFMGGGSHPILLLRTFLSPFNPQVQFDEFTERVCIKPNDDTNNAEFMHQKIRRALRDKGALIIEQFKVFPELAGDAVRFDGKYDDKQPFDDSRNVNHAVLVVGVRLTGSDDDMDGLEFLIQNSWKSKMFFTVGYDLLKSMGVKTLLSVVDDLKFNVSSHDSFEYATRMIESGSPRRPTDLQLESIPFLLDVKLKGWGDSAARASDESAVRVPSHYETDPDHYYHRFSDWKDTDVLQSM
jgi:hypothetical protein